MTGRRYANNADVKSQKEIGSRILNIEKLILALRNRMDLTLKDETDLFAAYEHIIEMANRYRSSPTKEQ